jgi:hypothetical protein
MLRTRSRCAAAALAALAACEAGTAPPPEPSLVGARNVVAGLANGGGHYTIPGLPTIRLALSGVGYMDGSATGRFHHSLTLDSELIEFHGAVTCLPVDPVNRRAWIGGVITANASTHPSFQGGIFEPGHDIWFRVVDYGARGDAQPDRTTFVGFEGSAGIATSAEYCELKIWPADDARTWPVEGDISVVP